MEKKSEDSKRGTLFIIAAPSGTGKTSLVKALLASHDRIVVSISYTTRPMRPGEFDGVDYHFVTDSVFKDLIKTGDLLEYAEVFDHCYGTSRTHVMAQLNKGLDVILEIDWQGAQQVRRVMPGNISIFILPPSRTALEQRLRMRKQDSEEVIKRRLRDAVTEISHYDEFNHILVNDNFDATLMELKAIIESPVEAYKEPSDHVRKTLMSLLVSR